MNTRKQGTIIQWFIERGFGFIQATSGKNIFCHISDWSDDAEFPPRVGLAVEFDLEAAKKGPKAINVLPIVQPIAHQPGLDALANTKQEIIDGTVVTTSVVGGAS
jgi:cold shock CspA family protein